MYTIFNKITSRTISFKVTLSNLKKDFNAKEIMLLIHILLIFNKPILQLNFIIYDHIFLRHGKIKIMSATSAFGMGINVSDVTLVIHTTFPNNIYKKLDMLIRIKSYNVLFSWRYPYSINNY